VFVEHAERELWQLFESIDRDHNGELNKDELRAAFSRAGLAISNAKLDQFFDEMDVNHDGVISFEEWRYEALDPVPCELEQLTSYPDPSCCSSLPNKLTFVPSSRTTRQQPQSTKKGMYISTRPCKA
jgi:hypothetical protein